MIQTEAVGSRLSPPDPRFSPEYTPPPPLSSAYVAVALDPRQPRRTPTCGSQPNTSVSGKFDPRLAPLGAAISPSSPRPATQRPYLPSTLSPEYTALPPPHAVLCVRRGGSRPAPQFRTLVYPGCFCHRDPSPAPRSAGFRGRWADTSERR